MYTIFDVIIIAVVTAIKPFGPDKYFVFNVWINYAGGFTKTISKLDFRLIYNIFSEKQKSRFVHWTIPKTLTTVLYYIRVV